MLNKRRTALIAVTMLGLMGIDRMSRRSGVTDAEFNGWLPGDELISDPKVHWMRGTTIEAPPSAVWPWLAQMGFGRGGWYTSVFFDRVVWGIENLSRDELVPEYQHVTVGDIIPDGPNYAAYFRVEDVAPGEYIVYRSLRHPWRGHPVDPTNPDELEAIEAKLRAEGVYFDFTWSWVLRPIGDSRSRLLVRTRADYSSQWMMLSALPLGLVDFYHTNTMFSGIKQRAAKSVN